MMGGWRGGKVGCDDFLLRGNVIVVLIAMVAGKDVA